MKTYITRLCLFTLPALLFLPSCSRNDSTSLFVELRPADTNIFFENTVREDTLFNSLNYLYFYDGGGVAAGDIDNDGLTDVYFSGNMTANRLYLNKGDFRFEDISESAGSMGETGGWTTGVTMADVNGDGYLDIYVCRANYLDKKGANQLFINNGDLTFSERAAEYGLAHTGLSRQAAFFDYDLDGDLDMYLLSHSVHSKNTYGRADELRAVRDDEAGDKLFRNDGGHFGDVTEKSGIHESILGYGLGLAIGDINQDGFPDVYVSNDFHEDDYLYYNNGDGTFTESMRTSMRHISLAAMGNDLADFNNDGLLDVVVMDMLPQAEDLRKSSITADPLDIYAAKQRFGYYHQLRRNTLQLNRGPAANEASASQAVPYLFSEVGQLAGVHATDWSWASLFVDLDNNGYKDLFVSNGIFRRANDLDYLVHVNKPETQALAGTQNPSIDPVSIPLEIVADITGRMPSKPAANYAFSGEGNLAFGNRAADWGLGRPGFSNGAAYADFDNDGAMDLAVNNMNAPASIYRNRLYQNTAGHGGNAEDAASHRANYLKVKLVGRGPNTFGLGAKVILHYGTEIFLQELAPTRGFQSSVTPVLNFGIGDISTIDSLEVIWPTGEYQVLKAVAANKTITLTQDEAPLVYRYGSAKKSSPLFTDKTGEIELDYRHQESTFIEFNREPFIPHFVSTEGPAVAVADIDGDGLEDLFLGGSKFQAGALFLQRKGGGFRKVTDSVFEKASRSEDVAAAFLDADGDGRQDLYVVSGGNEFFGRAEPLRDRLYLNKGGARFLKSDNLLPEIYANGSCVQPADFDNDGDLDLFVGSRSVARKYGAIPRSYLLVNDGAGTFTDETGLRAADLAHVGMVTAAIWTELNQDSFVDLVVVGEWMPLTVFHNESGKLVDVTAQYGLQNTLGWWHAIAAADFNQDGAIDLVAGNHGLNSALKTSSAEPVQLFINDYAGEGRSQQILTYYHDGKQYPLAERELLLANIPPLRSRFPDNASFAGKTIQEIFPGPELETAEVRKVTEFASALFMNTGAGSFDMTLLPRQAQFSPVYAISIADFDADGHQDLLLGGNFFGVRPMRGRLDAGYGSLLLGNGTGQFTTTSLQQSGFSVTGEIRQFKSLKTADGETLVLTVRNNNTVLFSRY